MTCYAALLAVASFHSVGSVTFPIALTALWNATAAASSHEAAASVAVAKSRGAAGKERARGDGHRLEVSIDPFAADQEITVEPFAAEGGLPTNSSREEGWAGNSSGIMLLAELTNPYEDRVKSKRVLALLEITFFGILGIDRMYMGQPWIGFLKLATGVCTCGVGGVIWGLFDWLVVMTNCLQSRPDINAFGYHADFQGGIDVHIAWYLACFGFVLLLCPCAFGVAATRKLLSREQAK